MWEERPHCTVSDYFSRRNCKVFLGNSREAHYEAVRLVDVKLPGELPGQGSE